MNGSDVPEGPVSRASGTTREQFLKRAGALGVAVSVPGLLAACGDDDAGTDTGSSGSSAPTKLRQGGELRIGLSSGSTADTTDPHKSTSTGDAARQFAIYSHLTQTNESTGDAVKVFNDLAESFEPNEKGDEWTLRLKDGVEFHNGKSLDVDDVVATWERITDPETGSLSIGRWAQMDMKNAKKMDKLTIRIPTAFGPNAIIDSLVGQTSAGGIIPVGFDPKKPVGTGPFKLVSFTPGRQTVLAPFENYHGEKPKVEKLTFVALPDDTARYNALLSNQIDVLDSVPLAQIDALKGNGKFAVSSLKCQQWFPMYMRLDQAPFDDVNVRQAIRLSVNRQQIVDSAFNGQALVGNDVFGRFDPDRDESLTREQDIEQAKSLLKKAGKENLTVEFVTAPAAAGALEMTQIFAENAKAAGINIKLRQVDLGTLYGPNYGKWPFALDIWPGFTYLVQTASWTGAQSPVNLTHQMNPTYSKLYQQALGTLDPAKRGELTKELQRIDFNEGGGIMAAYPNFTAAYSKGVGGFWPSNLNGSAVASGFYNKLGFVA